MINVKDAGAVGNGVHNDWSVLQTLINDGNGALYFPPGRYRIDSTLMIGNETGHHWFGCGMAPPRLSSDSGIGVESAIIWGGPNNGTMIQYEGVGMVWSGLALWGCHITDTSSSCPTVRAKYGINLSRPAGGGVGTGKMWFDSILIARCDTAIGTASAQQANCDTLGFGYCWLEDCNKGLHLQHEQAMMYTFEYLRARDVGTIFLVDDGGQIFTQTVAVDGDDTVVLDVKGGGTAKAHYAIGGVVIDEGTTNVKLLNNVAVPGFKVHCRFTNAHLRNSVSAVIDRTVGSANSTVLELVGCRGVASMQGNIQIKGASNTKSWLIVRDCEVPTGTEPVKSLLTGSSQHGYNGIANWRFADGLVPNEPPP